MKKYFLLVLTFTILSANSYAFGNFQGFAGGIPDFGDINPIDPQAAACSREYILFNNMRLDYQDDYFRCEDKDRLSTQVLLLNDLLLGAPLNLRQGDCVNGNLNPNAVARLRTRDRINMGVALCRQKGQLEVARDNLGNCTVMHELDEGVQTYPFLANAKLINQANTVCNVCNGDWPGPDNGVGGLGELPILADFSEDNLDNPANFCDYLLDPKHYCSK